MRDRLRIAFEINSPTGRQLQVVGDVVHIDDDSDRLS